MDSRECPNNRDTTCKGPPRITGMARIAMPQVMEVASLNPASALINHQNGSICLIRFSGFTGDGKCLDDNKSTSYRCHPLHFSIVETALRQRKTAPRSPEAVLVLCFCVLGLLRMQTQLAKRVQTRCWRPRPHSAQLRTGCKQQSS